MTAVLVDVEQPVRDWLRAQALVNVAARVYVGIPTDATYPAIDVQLLDGGIQVSATPLAVPLFSFSVWGNTRAHRAQVKETGWALADLIQGTDYAELDGLALLSAQVVLGPRPQYDDDGTPRYVIDAALTVRVR